jgi:hypothetical protein
MKARQTVQNILFPKGIIYDKEMTLTEPLVSTK